MKKYTNKILIVAIALFLIAATTIFFIETSKIKKAIEMQQRTELIINH
jgi:hypothetical protein